MSNHVKPKDLAFNRPTHVHILRYGPDLLEGEACTMEYALLAHMHGGSLRHKV